MVVDELAQYKLKYNAILKRYYAGCNYLQEHPDETDKYLKKVLSFRDELDEIIRTLSKKGYPMSKEEIVAGFEN